MSHPTKRGLTWALGAFLSDAAALAAALLVAHGVWQMSHPWGEIVAGGLLLFAWWRMQKPA